jgi:hypothetical protein
MQRQYGSSKDPLISRSLLICAYLVDDVHSIISSSSVSNFSSRASTISFGGDRLSKVTTAVGVDADDPKDVLGLNLLYTPSEPLIDFIFVHGLGGGSRKTWSKSSSVTHFWPQEWLPQDPAFKNVRLHSFGYSSNWAKGKDSVLNIHDFGKLLLGEMITSPHLGDEDVRFDSVLGGRTSRNTNAGMF